MDGGQESGQEAASLIGLWQEKYDFISECLFLILSGGDNWTGRGISTWDDGHSMVEDMNTMGYTTSAIGNPGFNFCLDATSAPISGADFPYLSANIREISTGFVPVKLRIQPYTMNSAS